MNNTPQHLGELAGRAGNRLEGIVPDHLRHAVSPLITWAAIHLGAVAIAETIIGKIRTPVGLHQLESALAPTTHHLLEASAYLTASTSTIASIDLCASAAARLAGWDPSRGEHDLNDVNKSRHRLHKASAAWVSKTKSAEVHLILEAARAQSVHRATPRGAQLSTTDHIPPDDFIINDRAYPVDALIRDFACHGEDTFLAFGAALEADWPTTD